MTAARDWLVDPTPYKAQVLEEEGEILALSNGLVRRVFATAQNGACIAFDSLHGQQSLLRAVRPEAVITLDGRQYNVGGLLGQPNHAYLTAEWLKQMTSDPKAFRFVGSQVEPIRERLTWKRVRHHAPGAEWPPRGVGLRLDFAAPDEADPKHRSVRVSVHYELYDGIPALCKWVRVINGGEASVELDRCAVECLAVVEHANWVEKRESVALPKPRSLHVETDFAFGGFVHQNANRHVVHWKNDPQFTSQVNYKRETPCLLWVEPTRGPDQMIESQGEFESFRTFELVHDSTDRERRGLAQRSLYRTVAPWVTENPLILHVVSTKPEVVRKAIDQAAECGFEMVSLSFGSGLNMEGDTEANHNKFRELVDYAANRGIHLGGYSLLSSRRVKPEEDNCHHPDTGKPGGQTHGFCPALASPWGLNYFRSLREFFGNTGFLQFTHDGSYPGDFDARSRPPSQRGVDDSQWVQWKVITDFYKELRGKGVYLRVPDYYFLSGSNECGMGYREVNWSLPRAQQVIHTRQNIFDGTWTKTPSMGWMFVPLTQYHGGGAAATIEPLDDHLDHYRQMMQSNLALGVQAVYRGHRLYDTDRVRQMVSDQVAWFKKHRDILEADLVHVRRADGRNLDCMLHVSPQADIRGMAVVFNPLDRPLKQTLRINVYYTGILGRVAATFDDGSSAKIPVGSDHHMEWEVEVPGYGMRWMLLR